MAESESKMEGRTIYISASQGESEIISGAWAAHPRIKKDVSGHILVGRDLGPQSLTVANYNFETDSLTEYECPLPLEQGFSPLKIAVHPGGEAVVVSFRTRCRLFVWQASHGGTEDDEIEMKLCPSEKKLGDLEDVRGQTCLLFNGDGSLLLCGGEDGCVRVFAWPSMEVILYSPQAFKSVKDLDISLDSKFVAATGDSRDTSCKIWDISKGSNVEPLQPLADEAFGFCRFSRDPRNAFLFISITKEKRGYIGAWDLFKWRRVGTKKYLSEPITSLAVTHHGKRLAMGTGRGNIWIVEVKTMKLEQVFKKAHSQCVSALEFSLNDKALLSLSTDRRSGVTALDLSKEWKDWQVYLILFGAVIASIVLFIVIRVYGDSFFNAPKQLSSSPQIQMDEFESSDLMYDNTHDEF